MSFFNIKNKNNKRVPGDRSARKQLHKLYGLNFLANISIAGAVWVALLASRGFTMSEIMMAETVFHIVSLINEIPSGMLADVIGRKKTMMLSVIFGMISSLSMAFIDCYAGVLISISFSALSYNYGSGTDAALAYDTLKEVNETEGYDRYSSIQSMIYRVSYGLASLSAGLALRMGYVKAELLSFGLQLISLIVILSLKESKVILKKTGISLKKKVKDCFNESLGFLRSNPKACALIIKNAIVGAVDILLLFALQDKLQRAGASELLLGPMLFLMYIGGVLGSIAAMKVRNSKLSRLFVFCFIAVLTGVACAFTGDPRIMTLGGVISAFADDLIQIRSDVALNNMVPENSRATLISVNSFCFSIVMIILSPIAGLIF